MNPIGLKPCLLLFHDRFCSDASTFLGFFKSAAIGTRTNTGDRLSMTSSTTLDSNFIPAKGFALRLLRMSRGVKTTCLEAPGVSLGGSGVSIGGVGSLRVVHKFDSSSSRRNNNTDTRMTTCWSVYPLHLVVVVESG